MKPSFKLWWEPLIFQQNIYRRKIHQECYRNWPNLSRQLEWGLQEKCFLGLKIHAECIFFHFWMALTLQNLKLGGNLEFSWDSCDILRYCSNRCIVWFYIPENCPAHANRKFPVQLYVKILFEPPFWIWKWANHLSFLAMSLSTELSTEERHR